MVDVSQHNIVFKGSNSEYGVNREILIKSIKNVLVEPVFEFLGVNKSEEEIDIEKIPEETDKIMMQSAKHQGCCNEVAAPVGRKFNIVI